MNIADIANNIVAYVSVLIGLFLIMLFFAKLDKKYNVLLRIQDWVNKPTLDKLDDYQKATNTNFDDIKKTLNEHTLDILALKVCTDMMPDEARYKASKRYIEAHGNSGVDVIAEKYIKEYRKKH